MKKSNRFQAICGALTSFAILLVIMLLSGAESFAQIDMSDTQKDEKIETIALVPFTSKSALSAELTDEQLATNERFLTISFYDALTAQVVGVKIKPLQESETEYNKLSLKKPGSYYRDIAVSAGKNLGVDAVITGVISRYTNRVGSNYGVETPASVAFSVMLLDTETEEILWETYFSETQKALLDNVYDVKKFFKRGAKWITADGLAKEGARKTALELNEYLLEN